MLFEPTYIKVLQSLAEKSHDGQLYGELPYMIHVNEVRNTTKSILSTRGMDYEDNYWYYVGVAIGHDLIEDTKVTIELLLDHGIPLPVVRGIEVITKKSGVIKEDYLNGVKSNRYSHLVKQADSLCNLIHSVREGNERRMRKYTSYLKILSEK